MNRTIYTIGHSNHQTDRFLGLLEKHDITAICDVRSKPYSRYNPQFNRDTIKSSLKDHGISYVFLGRELGARSDDQSCYVNGKVDYDILSRSESFHQGIQRIHKGVEKYRIALMCAEKDPIECHRTILIARHFKDIGYDIMHILADNTIESQTNALSRLIQKLGLESLELFQSRASIEAHAYRIQGNRIAYGKNLSIKEADSEISG